MLYGNRGLMKLLTLIGIGFILSIFLFAGCTQNGGIEVSNPLPPATLSVNDACKGVSNFMMPVCVSSIAFYNNDSSICDKITGNEQTNFTTGCKDTFTNGVFESKRYVLGNGSLLNDDDYTKECQTSCTNKNLKFIKLDTAWGTHSLNGYESMDANGTLKILSCYCFK